LYFRFRLPIIVVMKIRLRIGIEQSGPQSPQHASSADTKTRALRPVTLLALTREGSVCEGVRINGVRYLHAAGFSGMRPSLAPSASLLTAFLARKLPKIEGFFAKWALTSNRKCPKNRCYRKQRSKPLLTEARTHISDFGFRAFSLLPPATKKQAATYPSRHMSLARI
jgi:hypothetical protein